MRQVARHVWIRELLDGDYEERDGWEPNVLRTGRGDVSRVNVLGMVLSVNGVLVLDDGTGQAELRAFEEVPGLRESPGSFCLVVGRPRVYQDRFFLIPEVVRPVSPGWGLVRKQELGPVLAYERVETSVDDSIEEEVFVNDAEKLIAIISGLDGGDGASVDDVIRESGLGDEAEPIMSQLLLDGEVFEIRPGVVKVL